MQAIAIIAIILHVLPGVYWAGSTFVLAANGGIGAEALFPRQMGAATVVLLTGILLWSLFHSAGMGPMEMMLAVGAIAAILAAAIQGMMVGRARHALVASGGADPAARRKAALGYRFSAGLLALAVACMAAARFA